MTIETAISWLRMATPLRATTLEEFHMFHEAVDLAIEALKNKKTGKWLWNLADNGWADHTCSECGWTKNTDIHVSLGYKFCPNCGADMRKGEKNDNTY